MLNEYQEFLNNSSGKWHLHKPNYKTKHTYWADKIDKNFERYTRQNTYWLKQNEENTSNAINK